MTRKSIKKIPNRHPIAHLPENTKDQANLEFHTQNKTLALESIAKCPKSKTLGNNPTKTERVTGLYTQMVAGVEHRWTKPKEVRRKRGAVRKERVRVGRGGYAQRA